MSKAAKSVAKNVLPVVAGFGIGWGVITYMEDSQSLGPTYQLTTASYTLAAQRALAENVLVPMKMAPMKPGETPEMAKQQDDAMAPFVKKYLLANQASVEELVTLKEQIDMQLQMLKEDMANDDGDDKKEKKKAAEPAADRVPFTKVLRECIVDSQIDWLLDHVTEEVPFFYIGDIFHSWNTLHHEAAGLQAVGAGSDAATLATGFPNLAKLSEEERATTLKNCAGRIFGPQLNIEAYNYQFFVDNLWRKVIHGTVPFDVGVQSLALLATSSKTNAKYMAKESKSCIRHLEVISKSEEKEGATEQQQPSSMEGQQPGGTVTRRKEIWETGAEVALAMDSDGSGIKQFHAPFTQTILEMSVKYNKEVNEKLLDFPADGDAQQVKQSNELKQEKDIVNAATAQLLNTVALQAAGSGRPWWKFWGEKPAPAVVASQYIEKTWNKQCDELPTTSVPVEENKKYDKPFQEVVCPLLQAELLPAIANSASTTANSDGYVHGAGFVPAESAEVLQGTLDAMIMQYKC